MRMDELAEMRQFFGFMYFDEPHKKFKAFYPVDLIEGAMLDHLSAGKRPLLSDMIAPYYDNFDLLDIFSKAGKAKDLEYGLGPINVLPKSEEFGSTVEVSASVPSRTILDAVHKPAVRGAFDINKYETYCTCEIFQNKRICGVWHPYILDHWGLPITGDKRSKYYSEPTCTHIGALDQRVRREYGQDVFGVRVDGSKKPYVMAHLDLLERFPGMKRYVEDVAFTYFSPMFENVKSKANDARRSARPGIGDLTMYDNDYLKDFMVRRMDDSLARDKSKHMPKNMNEVIDTISFYF
ncbi:MAG: hypothetical protein NT016_01520 [Candidatus Aenigmarchaeota archaeon]|nr:hypothetical protein [Candidatus Aenigmarchaeota archaeon]